MRDIWFISDTHFGHEKIITYADRPFDTVSEMDETIAENWSSRVKHDDLIYHLGDIAWTGEGLKLFASLPGTKRLILGNHDNGKACAPLVQKLELFRRFPEHGFIASHMPMLMEQKREPANVHGHVHNVDTGIPDAVNISIEKTNYAPLHFDELLARIGK